MGSSLFVLSQKALTRQAADCERCRPETVSTPPAGLGHQRRSRWAVRACRTAETIVRLRLRSDCISSHFYCGATALFPHRL